jgi:RNA polymerase sigma factor (sigma-70 family)
MNGRQAETQTEQLVQQHRGLVEHIVDRYTRKYHIGTMERDDLVSWGLIGLYQAARAWDASRNLKFSTLAWKVIERAIIRGVQREWRPDEAQATVSLEEILLPTDGSGNGDLVLGEALPDPSAEATSRTLDTAIVVRNALSRLPRSERELIRQRFYEGRSCAEVGELSGKTRQSVHLREKSILRHLRRELRGAFEESGAA